MLHLSTFGQTQADDTPRSCAVDEGHLVQAIALRNQANHAQFVVLESIVYPDERLIPGQFGRKGERQAMRGQIELVFGRIEVDAHAFIVATKNRNGVERPAPLNVGRPLATTQLHKYLATPPPPAP